MVIFINLITAERKWNSLQFFFLFPFSFLQILRYLSKQTNNLKKKIFRITNETSVDVHALHVHIHRLIFSIFSLHYYVLLYNRNKYTKTPYYISCYYCGLYFIQDLIMHLKCAAPVTTLTPNSEFSEHIKD